MVVSGLLEANTSLDHEPRKKPRSLQDTSVLEIWAELVTDNCTDINTVRDGLDEEKKTVLAQLYELIAIEFTNVKSIIDKSPVHLFFSFFYIHQIDGKKFSRFSIFRNSLTGNLRTFRSFQSYVGLHFLGAMYKVYISIST